MTRAVSRKKLGKPACRKSKSIGEPTLPSFQQETALEE
jgi:hypothetical protein